MASVFSSEKLITLRKLKGYSQEKLAEDAGINIRTLQRIEKNEVKPQPHTLGRLAGCLQVGIEDLYSTALIAGETEETKKTVSLLHFSALLGCVLPLGNIIAPCFLWLYKKQNSSNNDVHARAVINFQVSWLLYTVIVLTLFFSLESFAFLVFLIPPMSVFCLVICPVISGIRILNDKTFFYPFSLRILKTS